MYLTEKRKCACLGECLLWKDQGGEGGGGEEGGGRRGGGGRGGEGDKRNPGVGLDRIN